MGGPSVDSIWRGEPLKLEYRSRRRCLCGSLCQPLALRHMHNLLTPAQEAGLGRHALLVAVKVQICLSLSGSISSSSGPTRTAFNPLAIRQTTYVFLRDAMACADQHGPEGLIAPAESAPIGIAPLARPEDAPQDPLEVAEGEEGLEPWSKSGTGAATTAGASSPSATACRRCPSTCCTRTGAST